MAVVESAAPVIDVEALLQPISDENPSGESLQYSGLYDEIREARRADDTLSRGQWETALKVADYREVISLAVPAIRSQSKDLQICAWLSEALTKEHGFVGLRDSLQLMRGIEENFWETCFPEIDEGDQEGRANAIQWVENQLSIAVKGVPLTESDRLSYIKWDESKQFDIPENIDTLSYEDQQKYNELRARAETENRVTGEMWRRAKSQTSRAFAERLNLTLDETWTALEALDRMNEEKFDRNQMPGLRQLKKSLEDIRSIVKTILEERRKAEPDPEEDAPAETAGENGAATNGATATASGVGATAAGAIRSREDALRRLADLADFFRRTEPHSPISYLVTRAVKWGNMPLDGWLQDVVKDQSVLSQLREMLGVGSDDSM